MKKTMYCFLTLLLLISLTACGERQASEPSYDPEILGESIIESQAGLPSLTSLTSKDSYFTAYLCDYYLLDGEQVEGGVIYYADGVEASEIAVLLLKEDLIAQAIQSQLLEYLTNRASVFEGYAPQQTALVKKGRVVIHGRYIALLICQDVESAQRAFENCFTGSDISQSTEDSESISDTYADAGNNMQSNDAPTDDAYDENAILLAWRTGDNSSLSDMNRSILDAAKAAIAQEITGSMSDYEKELAIHDWMTGWSSFDMNVFSHAPAARAEADNRNPYGFLIDRSAMCHGYSSTFQLFMDMLDIECITVFGTPSANGVQHSWNMVRLDGEWYCVDTAWDDPIGGSPCHTYFNVTSQRLRDGSIHRWDDSSVPEATATTYRYDRR